MLRRILIGFLLLSLFLAGCQSQTTMQATGAVVTQSDSFSEASPVSAATEVPIPTETKSPVKTDVKPLTPTTSGEEVAVSSCTVVSREPTPGPTQVSLFPPPGESDWVVGPETAVMTIYEYSDFQ
jgi:hypothetical protein